MEFPFAISMPMLLSTAVLLFAYFFISRRRSKKLNLPPGPPTLPLVGNLFDLAFLRKEQRELIDDWAREYGDIYMFTVFGTRFVILNDYALVQEVYNGFDVHGRAPILPCNKALRRPNTGLGIIGSDAGESWSEIRKLVHNLLRNVKHTDVGYGQLVTAQALRFVEEVSKHSGSDFDPRDGIYVTVANIANTIVVGKTYDYDDEEFKRLTELIRDVFEYMALGTFNYHVPVLAAIPFGINGKGETAIKKMFVFIADVIKRYRESFEFDENYEPVNFMETFLMEQHRREKQGHDAVFDDATLTQVTFDLYVTGFEAVSTSLCWYFLFMAQHPDVQTRVQAELDSVIGRNRMPDVTDRVKTPFTEAVMTESYRISGMVPSQVPRCAKTDGKVRGYDIPKGTYFSVNSHWLAYNPEIWENPREFRPERFIDADGQFASALDAKLAEFGAGRRACVGEQLARNELYIIFTHVMHRFTLRLPEGTPISLAGVNGLTYQPLPYKLRIIPRD